MGIESLVKMILVALLVLAGLAVWLLPKTRLLKRRRIGQTAFIATCIVGIVCGAAGLVVTFAWPGRVIDWHLWELTAMPVVFMYVFWIIVARQARRENVLDEKQELDMAAAGNITLGVSIAAMTAVFVLRNGGLFDSGLWFPFFLFTVLLVYSAAALYRFKRA